MQNLEPKAETILKVLKDAEIGLTQRELTEQTGYSRPTITSYSEQLRRKNLISTVSKGSAKLYFAQENLPADYRRGRE